MSDNPENIDILKKIAQVKYFLLDFEGALKAFEKARKINNNNLDFLIGEANTRLLIEKENISEKTIKLFKKINKEQENDINALIILANYYYDKKDYNSSKKFYLKLQSLIDKNSLEYNDIQKRLEEIKKLQ